jgi:sugar phosphate isomerase/epimerase
MRLGIFARTFARPTVEAVFDAVRVHGLKCVQFNLSCAGLPTLPDEIAPTLITRIHEAALSREIEIAAISGTYNMIHPDPQVQQVGLRRLRTLAAACHGLGQAHAIQQICGIGIQRMHLPSPGRISYALWRLLCASLRRNR